MGHADAVHRWGPAPRRLRPGDPEGCVHRMTAPRAQADALPELHLADWRPTKDTLHLYCQILGKIRLATSAPRNQWWHVPLYLDVRGLTTRRMHHHSTT